MPDNISIRCKRFIEQNAELIKQSAWISIYYEKLPKENVLAPGEFTDFLLGAEINPLEGLPGVPYGYLCGSKLTSFMIPNYIDKIDSYAFYGSKLKSIKIPRSVKSIGVSAFEASTLSDIEFEGDSISLGTNCFGSTNLKSVTLPGIIPLWDKGTFQQCQKLLSVELSEGLEVLPIDTFKYCANMESIILPSTIKRLGRHCIMGTNLDFIDFKGTVEQWNSIAKDEEWNEGAPRGLKVKCLDGELYV